MPQCHLWGLHRHIVHIMLSDVCLTGIEIDFHLIFCGRYTSSSRPSGYRSSAHSYACELARLWASLLNTAPRTHAHSHMHTPHTHTHTHHMHAARVHFSICVCSTSFSLELAIPPLFSCDLSSFVGDMVETVTSFFFGSCLTVPAA